MIQRDILSSSITKDSTRRVLLYFTLVCPLRILLSNLLRHLLYLSGSWKTLGQLPFAGTTVFTFCRWRKRILTLDAVSSF